MLFFAIIIILLAASVTLAVNIVKTLRLKRKYLGKDALSDIADESVKNAQNKDPFITCDFCGAKIDTRLYRTCPQCGGAFGRDAEWETRHHVNSRKATENAEDGYRTAKETFRKKTLLEKSRIRKSFLILSGAVLFAVLITVGVTWWMSHQRLLDEEVTETYTKEDYDFSEQKILDTEDYTVWLGDVYSKPGYEEGSTNYEIEIYAINNTGQAVSIGVHVIGANKETGTGLVSSVQEKIPGDRTPHKKILRLRNVHTDCIRELTVESVVMENDNGAPLAGEPARKTYKTTAEGTTEEFVPTGNRIYADNLMAVWYEKPDDRYGNEFGTLQVINTGNTGFKLSGKAVADDKEISVYIRDRVFCPEWHGIFHVEDIMYRQDIKDAEELLISLSAEADDVKQSVTTPYLPLEQR